LQLLPRAGPGTSRALAKRRQATRVRQDQSFKGRKFTAEVILWAVRWYLMLYPDLELMLLDRGVEVEPHQHLPLDPGVGRPEMVRIS
jgi:hypothetical protein